MSHIEARVRRELMGHEDSELWGEGGLLAATRRSVIAIGAVEDALLSGYPTPEDTLNAIKRIMGVLKPEEVNPLKSPDYTKFCGDKISEGYPPELFYALPSLWFDEVSANGEWEAMWEKCNKDDNFRLTTIDILESKKTRSNVADVVSCINTHGGNPPSLPNGKRGEACICGCVHVSHSACASEWVRFWKKRVPHGMSFIPESTPEACRDFCLTYLMIYDEEFKRNNPEIPLPDLSKHIKQR
jgi:hypothetical protein